MVTTTVSCSAFQEWSIPGPRLHSLLRLSTRQLSTERVESKLTADAQQRRIGSHAIAYRQFLHDQYHEPDRTSPSPFPSDQARLPNRPRPVRLQLPHELWLKSIEKLPPAGVATAQKLDVIESDWLVVPLPNSPW